MNLSDNHPISSNLFVKEQAAQKLAQRSAVPPLDQEQAMSLFINRGRRHSNRQTNGGGSFDVVQRTKSMEDSVLTLEANTLAEESGSATLAEPSQASDHQVPRILLKSASTFQVSPPTTSFYNPSPSPTPQPTNNSPTPLQHQPREPSNDQHPRIQTSEYLHKQRLRQAKEQEVKLMMNRIALLQGERERIDKRVLATQKRAAEIFYNKLLNEDKIREKMRLESQEREEQEQAKMRNFQMRESQRREIQIKLDELRQQLQSNAEERKRQKQQNIEKKRQDQMLMIMEAREKKEAVKKEEERIRANIEKFKHKKETQHHGLRVTKVENEHTKLQEADAILSFLEQKEQQILNALKSTQYNENQAKQVLVDAIMQTTKSKWERVVAAPSRGIPIRNEMEEGVSVKSYFNGGSSLGQIRPYDVDFD
ncbi:hypothetical protein FGO68_gene9763 [Halteria grandinella]|uniref:Uncharacterized protein n=1 Tax=Halteria grandinella TaxID=5974 RepID=A0A8J8ND23_HALGN|nr:hypothetical protein FGO68_gene9763 [Halteria grandinella]